MSSNIISPSQESVDNGRDEFAKSQERMFQLMKESNQLREQELEVRKQELQQGIEHDKIIKERIITDIEQAEVEKQKNILLDEKNKQEHQKVIMMEQQLTDLKIIIELLKNYLSQTVPSQDSKLSNFHQKLDWILDLLRIILSRMLPDAEKEERNRLTELLKHLAQSGNSINIKPDVNISGSVDAINNADSSSTINYNKR